MKKYKKRVCDQILEKKLLGKGAVLIEGPKWCGKTTTAEQQSKSVIYMDDSEKKNQYLIMAEINPKKLLEGENPRLIDEWQLAPKLWDTIRFEVDHRDDFGQFILSGSSVPVDTEEISHSGTGRFSWITMRPMSLYESCESSGEVSLKELFETPEVIYGTNKLSFERIAYVCCRGGWPKAIDLDEEIALEQAFDYYDAIVKKDISKADGVNRNPERVKRLMRSYSRNIGSQASAELICKDMKVNDESTFDSDTVISYINALKKIFVIEDLEAWKPNLRSKTSVRTADTRYFVDPSIAIASLGMGPNDLMNDLKTFDFIFESLCIRDLRVFANALKGNVFHYRDKNNLECDAVVHLRNGKYGLIEIKLGGDKLIEEGCENLKKLKSKIDTDKMNEPSFLCILTATTPYAYRRPDGIYVVPIGCLKD